MEDQALVVQRLDNAIHWINGSDQNHQSDHGSDH